MMMRHLRRPLPMTTLSRRLPRLQLVPLALETIYPLYAVVLLYCCYRMLFLLQESVLLAMASCCFLGGSEWALAAQLLASSTTTTTTKNLRTYKSEKHTLVVGNFSVVLRAGTIPVAILP
jgi:hypothetical protein